MNESKGFFSTDSIFNRAIINTDRDGGNFNLFNSRVISRSETFRLFEFT